MSKWAIKNNFYIVDNRWVIAEIDRHSWTTIEEINYNVRLIKSAPELLERLQDCIDTLLDMGEYMRPCVRDARELIATIQEQENLK